MQVFTPKRPTNLLMHIFVTHNLSQYIRLFFFRMFWHSSFHFSLLLNVFTGWCEGCSVNVRNAFDSYISQQGRARSAKHAPAWKISQRDTKDHLISFLKPRDRVQLSGVQPIFFFSLHDLLQVHCSPSSSHNPPVRARSTSWAQSFQLTYTCPGK